MPAEENYLKKELYDLIKKDSSIFEFLQSESLDGIWFWDLENQENEWMSPTFWTNFGYDPSEKKHLSKEWQDMIFPEDLKVATENFLKHLKDPNHPYDQIVRYKKRDGSTSWVRCRGVAIRDENGKPIRMLGAHNDITKVKEAERFNAHILNSMLSSFALHEIILDKNGKPVDYRFINVNPTFEKMTGLKTENILGKTVTEILPGIEKDPVNWIEKYGSVALGGAPIRFENYSEPIKKWFSISAFSPKENFFVTIFDDITQDKNKIEELGKINKLMVDRELRMLELKKEIEELKAKLENK